MTPKTWPLLALAGLSVLTAPAFCLDALPGNTDFGLAPLTGFGDAAAAGRQCAPDAAVWADSGNGYFYATRDPEFGTSRKGVFACLHAALDAGYWDRNPFSNMKDRGRVFPINPDLLCPACS